MTSNMENSRIPKPGHHRKQIREAAAVVDKENIGHHVTKPITSVCRKLFPSDNSVSGKPRKAIDSEQFLRQAAGLQEVDQSNKFGAAQKHRGQLLNTNAPGVKPTSRKSFDIYDDNARRGSDESTGKLPHRRETGPRRSSVKFELPIPEQPERQACKENIKEVHEQAAYLKKSCSKDASIGLPIDAIYNLQYMTEYIRFQMDIHERKKLSPSFLMRSVTPDQRRLIVKYLINASSYHKYPSFILHQAVKIFDFYIDAVNVPVYELQVSALAALWIALKKDSTYGEIPKASIIMKLGDSMFQSHGKKSLIDCERKILSSLHFEVSYADPLSMLALNLIMIDKVRAMESDNVKELYYCGCYLLDLALLYDKLLNFSAMHLASISAEIALMIYMTSDDNLDDPQRWSYWRSQVFKATPIIEKYRLPESQMNNIRNMLLQKTALSNETATDYHVIYKKYDMKRYGCVSKLILSKITSLSIKKIVNPIYVSSKTIVF